MERSQIHVLLIAKDTSAYIDRSYYYLETILAQKTKLSIWRESGHIQKILKRLDIVPDFILIVQDIGNKLEPMVYGLREISIPSGVFVNDVHRFTEARRSFFRKNKDTYLFSVTRDACKRTYSEFKQRTEWLPHFIEPTIFTDYELKKEVGILMLGATDASYPFRQYVRQELSSHPEFLSQVHPGYIFFEDSSAELVGKRYAMELNKAKVFITCPSIYNYPVKKYYEALACGTLLLAPSFKELEDLGFIPGRHFVQVNEQNVSRAVEFYLQNEIERNEIIKNGYYFVHNTHTTSIRVEQLISRMKDV